MPWQRVGLKGGVMHKTHIKRMRDRRKKLFEATVLNQTKRMPSPDFHGLLNPEEQIHQLIVFLRVQASREVLPGVKLNAGNFSQLAQSLQEQILDTLRDNSLGSISQRFPRAQ